MHLNAAYYGGRHLDRFSRYQFGLFDENRVRGVPSAGVRFAELGMIRGSYSFNVFDQYRLDVFVDQAVGRNSDRDAAAADTWRAFTGVGIGVNFRAPWNTMFRGDIGKSFLPQPLLRLGFGGRAVHDLEAAVRYPSRLAGVVDDAHGKAGGRGRA